MTPPKTRTLLLRHGQTFFNSSLDFHDGHFVRVLGR